MLIGDVSGKGVPASLTMMALINTLRALAYKVRKPDEMLRLLNQPHAEAYFCGDDVLSIGAMSAIQSRGLKIPEDIGILGLNDMEIAGWDIINLTTIQQPIKDIVNSTIELIVAVMENPSSKPESRLFPCEIVERGTLRSP